MLKRPHPARRARYTAGAVGTAGFVGLTWAIAATSTAPAVIDLTATLGPNPASNPSGAGLSLSGGAIPVDPAVLDAAVAAAGAIAPIEPAPAEPASTASATTAPASTAPATTTPTTAPATAPATTPTTAPASHATMTHSTTSDAS